MTKRTEFIPFMGVVEIDDEVPVDRDLYSRSQQEVANEIGISKEAVGQAERRALKKAKELLTKKYKKSDLI